MKKIALFLVVAMLALAMIPAVMAAEDYLIVDLRTEEAANASAKVTKGGQLAEATFTGEGYHVVTTGGTDPNATVKFNDDFKFNAEDYPIIRVDYRVVDGDPVRGQIFFQTTTDEFKMGNSGTYVEYPIDVTEADWQSAIIDMELINNSQWADIVELVRLDMAVPAADDVITMDMRFVGFFKDEKAAEAFDIEKYAPAAAETKTEETKEEAPAAEEAKEEAPAAEEEKAPETADAGLIAVLAAMAVSAGAALSIKKRK